MKYRLKRRVQRPGYAVQRFGDWKKGQPSVLIDNQRWLDLGKPDEVEVIITLKNADKINYCGT